MNKEAKLSAYWITVPGNPSLTLGIGVTAYSQEDALDLIRLAGLIDSTGDDIELRVESDIDFTDLDQNHVVPNMGPMHFRGVWYPCSNVGYGAPKHR